MTATLPPLFATLLDGPLAALMAHQIWWALVLGFLISTISFGGVLAFIFADLIIVPIVIAYRKFHGTRDALRITALMFVAVFAAMAWLARTDEGPA